MLSNSNKMNKTIAGIIIDDIPEKRSTLILILRYWFQQQENLKDYSLEILEFSSRKDLELAIDNGVVKTGTVQVTETRMNKEIAIERSPINLTDIAFVCIDHHLDLHRKASLEDNGVGVYHQLINPLELPEIAAKTFNISVDGEIGENVRPLSHADYFQIAELLGKAIMNHIKLHENSEFSAEYATIS
jgi:hypothetical protein